MSKINHGRATLRLIDSGGGEPHWSGFEKQVQPAKKKPKKRVLSPKLLAERLHFMEQCVFAIENGDGFPPVPKRLKVSIMVNKNMDRQRLISAWLGRQADFREIQASIRHRIAVRKSKQAVRQAAT